MDVLNRRRVKKVSDGLGTAAKARLWGRSWETSSHSGSYESSGSEHEGLSSLVHAFFESDDSECNVPFSIDNFELNNVDSDGENHDVGDRSSEKDTVSELHHILHRVDGKFHARLKSDVVEVMKALSEKISTSGASACRRGIMSKLRDIGYNAGLCKAKWDATPNLAKGNYEYIDVVTGDNNKKAEKRYIIDVGFANEFVVARSTEYYEKVMAELPAVLVARPEDVKKAVRIAAKAARLSLKSQGLHVPPWRKGRYMIAKWLGDYRRTVNAVPANVAAKVDASIAVVAVSGDAKCRSVGFELQPDVIALPVGTIW